MSTPRNTGTPFLVPVCFTLATSVLTTTSKFERASAGSMKARAALSRAPS
jgi:hypothetical protein